MPNTATYKDWLFVDVGKDASRFEIGGNYLYFIAHGGMSVRSRIEIGPGSWQIIGKGDALSESDWEWIVEQNEIGWENYKPSYEDKAPNRLLGYKNATESGHSLLRSLEMEPGTTLVLKKNEPIIQDSELHHPQYYPKSDKQR